MNILGIHAEHANSWAALGRDVADEEDPNQGGQTPSIASCETKMEVLVMGRYRIEKPES